MARESSKTFTDKSGNRRGFVQKRTDNSGRTTYGVGIDNTGSPYRGVLDESINTPLGSLGYGYDGDTSFLSYQAPYVQGFPGGGALMSGGERMGFVDANNGRYGFGIDKVGSPYRGVMEREINTPLGTIDYGYDGDTVGAGITPNYYLQALANLLRR